MADLKDLRERVEKTDEPDRELDALVWAITEGHKVEYDGPTEGASEVWAIGDACTYSLGWRDDGKHTKHFTPNHPVDPYTASIDAAVALIERKLERPSIKISWGSCNAAGEMFLPSAELSVCVGEKEFGWTWKRVAYVKAKTPALALIAALLAALEEVAARTDPVHSV